MQQQGMTCNHCGAGAGCSCWHHKLVPLLITLIGVTFLLGVYHVLTPTFVNMAWPILLILIGLFKMCEGMCPCCGMKK